MKNFNIKSIIKRQFLDAGVKLLKPKDAITVSPKSSVLDAIKLMVSKKVGSVVISSKVGTYDGIFTERDVLKGFASHGVAFLSMNVKTHMSSPLQVQSNNGSIARAMYTMSGGRFRHLGITDPSGKLSMISVKDILDYLYNALTNKIFDIDDSTFFDENSVDLFFLSQVGDLKPKPTVWVPETMPIKEVVSLMSSRKVGCALVGSDQKPPLGIFTERDFLLHATEVGSTIEVVTVSSCMTSSPKNALQSTSVALVMNLMCKGGFRHIPIVDELEKHIGVLTVSDFFDYLASHILSELEAK